LPLLSAQELLLCSFKRRRRASLQDEWTREADKPQVRQALLRINKLSQGKRNSGATKRGDPNHRERRPHSLDTQGNAPRNQVSFASLLRSFLNSAVSDCWVLGSSSVPLVGWTDWNFVLFPFFSIGVCSGSLSLSVGEILSVSVCYRQRRY
jgi:hypothetical protein